MADMSHKVGATDNLKPHYHGKNYGAGPDVAPYDGRSPAITPV